MMTASRLFRWPHSEFHLCDFRARLVYLLKLKNVVHFLRLLFSVALSSSQNDLCFFDHRRIILCNQKICCQTVFINYIAMSYLKDHKSVRRYLLQIKVFNEAQKNP